MRKRLYGAWNEGFPVKQIVSIKLLGMISGKNRASRGPMSNDRVAAVISVQFSDLNCSSHARACFGPHVAGEAF